MMTVIEVDFDVFKELTRRRSSEGVTYNDVLRDLLRLGPKKTPVASADSVRKSGYWIAKGVRFPIDTPFRAIYKGQTYPGKVTAKGLVVKDRCFSSPSSAAFEITGKSTNGWIFWQCLIPGTSSWQTIDYLRKQKRDL